MIDHDEFDPLAHVIAAAPAVGLKFTPERAAEIAAAFALVLRVGAPALEYEVPEGTEPAPVFAP
jgi:hypothetical protein